MAPRTGTQTGTQSGKGKSGNGAAGEKAKRTADPFRGVLSRLNENRAMKIELGVLEEDAEVDEIVRDKATGNVYRVKLQMLKKGGE